MAEGSILVQKYGGSSVATPERIKAVAAHVVRTKEQGHKVVVVVSAMGENTDHLLSLARQVTPHPDRRELDMLLTVGERISMALLSMAVKALGHDAISFTGSQCGIMTNDNHFAARIVEVRPFRVQDELYRGRIVIVAGYQGTSYKREVTTLGRGGSDTTAVALAAALGAEACEIYSDVDGVYSADPRVIPEARHLPALGHGETAALALAGAKVLNAQAVQLAREKGIAIHARATRDPLGRETVVRLDAPPLEPRVVAVTGRRDLVLLAGPAGERPLARLAEVASGHALALHWSESHGTIEVLLDPEESEIVAPAGWERRAGLSTVAAVGNGIDKAPQLCARILDLLQEGGWPVEDLTLSEAALTARLGVGDSRPAQRLLHERLIASGGEPEAAQTVR